MKTDDSVYWYVGIIIGDKLGRGIGGRVYSDFSSKVVSVDGEGVW